MRQKSKIIALVSRGASDISPLWSIQNFIAINPLHNLEKLRFETAIKKVYSEYGYLSLPDKSMCMLAYKNGWLSATSKQKIKTLKTARMTQKSESIY